MVTRRAPIRILFVDRSEPGVSVTRAEYERSVDAIDDLPAMVASLLHKRTARRRRELDRCARKIGAAISRTPSDRLPMKPSGKFAARGPQQALFLLADVMPEWIRTRTRSKSGAVVGALASDCLCLLVHRDERARVGARMARTRTITGASPQREPQAPTKERRAARGGAWRDAHTIRRVNAASKLDLLRYNDFWDRRAEPRTGRTPGGTAGVLRRSRHLQQDRP